MSIVMTVGLLGCVVSIAGCAGVSGASRSEVHVQLNDGQVLVGRMTTPQFSLKTAFGTMRFDADEAGELGPLEGDDMQQAGNLIRLWLRNGSEFVGGWENPVVEMALSVGGREIPVEVPIDKLERLRFRGQPVYTDRPLYRVLTRSGDDFFVDAGTSRIHFDGELGSFSPFLAEIASLEKLDSDDNLWSVRLKNGTRLHSRIQADGVALHPAMGPGEVTLSWKLVARLEPASMRAPAAPLAAAKAQQAAAPATSYYDNSMQRRLKEDAAKTWK